MPSIEYSDMQRADFLEVAKEIGITRAQRQLGYPAAWNTARRWVEAAGIEVPLDTIKAQAAAHWEWYKAEEQLIVAKELLLRIVEKLQADDLSADDVKKLAESYQKAVNTTLLLEGKATSITESRKTGEMDLAIADLIAAENARNELLEQSEDITSE